MERYALFLSLSDVFREHWGQFFLFSEEQGRLMMEKQEKTQVRRNAAREKKIMATQRPKAAKFKRTVAFGGSPSWRMKRPPFSLSNKLYVTAKSSVYLTYIILKKGGNRASEFVKYIVCLIWLLIPLIRILTCICWNSQHICLGYWSKANFADKISYSIFLFKFFFLVMEQAIQIAL